MESPILNGCAPGPHKIQGMGANFVPAILDRDVYDEVIDVNITQAVETARRLGTEEVILGGISMLVAAVSVLVVKDIGAAKIEGIGGGSH